MGEVILLGGVRTPQGKYGGALATVRADDLAALVVGAAVARAGVPADAIDEVVLGAANQAGEGNRDVARMAVLLAGLLNRLRREGGRRGPATLCVGVGQGMAMLVEAI
jgi:acetyl-CoA acetyltransferase